MTITRERMILLAKYGTDATHAEVLELARRALEAEPAAPKPSAEERAWTAIYTVTHRFDDAEARAAIVSAFVNEERYRKAIETVLGWPLMGREDADQILKTALTPEPPHATR